MPKISLKEMAYKYSPRKIHPLIRRVEASDVGSRLASGTFWSLAGAVISRGLMMAATVLVARLLGKGIYGEYGIIQSTVNMFLVFAGFGLGLTATKHVAEFRRNDPARAGRIIAISSLFALITGLLIAAGQAIFAPQLAEKILNAPHLTGVLRIGSIILFLNALNGAQTGALAGFEAFRTIARVNLAVGLASFPLLVGGAYFGGLEGTVWALGICTGINWILNHLALRKEAKRFNISLALKNCTKEWPILWKFSLPATLSGIVVAPVRWTCAAFLVNQPDGYDQMGLFTAALTFQMMVLFGGRMIGTPLLSMLSNAGSKISDQLGRVNILISWIIGVAAVVPLLCFPEVAMWIFGKDYSGRQFCLTFSLVLLFTCIVMYKQGLARVLTANNLLWWSVFSNAIWAIILIGSVWHLAEWGWGAVGLALSYLIAYIVNTIIIMPIYYKKRLIPFNMLISTRTVIVWTLVFSPLALSYWQISIGYRAVWFCAISVALFYALKGMAMPLKK